MHLKGRSIIYSSMQHLVDRSRDAQYALNYLSVEVRCVRESADIKQCWNKKKVLQRCSRVFQADKCREWKKDTHSVTSVYMQTFGCHLAENNNRIQHNICAEKK